MDATIIFPHQLFKEHLAVKKGRVIYLVEEWLFFNQYNFNKQKLVLHRASMKFYEQYLQQKKFEVKYIDAQQELCDVRKLVPHLVQQHITLLHIAEVADDWLERRLKHACSKENTRNMMVENAVLISMLF